MNRSRGSNGEFYTGVHTSGAADRRYMPGRFFRSGGCDARSPAAAEIGWRDYFADSQLQSMIAQAL